MPNADFQRAFDQAMDLWILPEIERRQSAGKIGKPYKLHAAQIIFYADARPRKIRLNEEVKALAKVKLKEDFARDRQEGETIFEHEIEHYESLRLPETEDPNCGHLTLIHTKGNWYLFLDCVYNRGRSEELLQAAKEFLAVAEHALSTGSFRALADNLFSAAELAATAILISSPRPGDDLNMSHKQIHSRFNLAGKLGNVDISHRETFNSLANLRARARYVKGAFVLTLSEATFHLAAVRDLIECARALIKRE